MMFSQKTLGQGRRVGKPGLLDFFPHPLHNIVFSHCDGSENITARVSA
jgi:hypothetical protein